jgi:hypothetical protein
MNICSFTLDAICGVDFSGARLAGRNTWLARLEPASPKSGVPRLAELACLEKLCGTADRAAALAHLVSLIGGSQRTLWALDFPFGLPVEVAGDGAAWADPLAFVGAWDEGAYELGLECIRRALALGGRMHIRRLTDTEARAPFDCYHYRIIYQTEQNP